MKPYFISDLQRSIEELPEEKKQEIRLLLQVNHHLPQGGKRCSGPSFDRGHCRVSAGQPAQRSNGLWRVLELYQSNECLPWAGPVPDGGSKPAGMAEA